MAGIEALAAELATDPLGRGYASMDDAGAATSLNVRDRQVAKPSLSGDQIFNAASPSELATLATVSPVKLQMFLALCARDSIDPLGAANVRLVSEIFGAGSATLNALGTLRMHVLSRGEEIGFGRVGTGDVAEARS